MSQSKGADPSAQGKFSPKQIVLRVGFALAATVLLFFVMGNRFTPEAAARASRQVEKDTHTITQIAAGDYHVIYKGGADTYWTAVTKRSLFIWKNRATLWVARTQDPVRLVGWCSIAQDEDKLEEGGRGVTSLAVMNMDESVAFIQAGTGDRLQKIQAPVGHTAAFIWEEIVPWDALDVVALSAEGDVLYRLQGGAQGETISFAPVAVSQKTE